MLIHVTLAMLSLAVPCCGFRLSRPHGALALNLRGHNEGLFGGSDDDWQTWPWSGAEDLLSVSLVGDSWELADPFAFGNVLSEQELDKLQAWELERRQLAVNSTEQLAAWLDANGLEYFQLSERLMRMAASDVVSDLCAGSDHVILTGYLNVCTEMKKGAERLFDPPKYSVRFWREALLGKTATVREDDAGYRAWLRTKTEEINENGEVGSVGLWDVGRMSPIEQDVVQELSSQAHCSEVQMNTKYRPLNMHGQPRSVESNIYDCRKRCATIQGCAHFSYWPNRGCHLQHTSASPSYAQGVTAGPPVCQEQEGDESLSQSLLEHSEAPARIKWGPSAIAFAPHRPVYKGPRAPVVNPRPIGNQKAPLNPFVLHKSTQRSRNTRKPGRPTLGDAEAAMYHAADDMVLLPQLKAPMFTLLPMRQLRLGLERHQRAAKMFQSVMKESLIWGAGELAMAASGGTLTPMIVWPAISFARQRLEIARGDAPDENSLGILGGAVGNQWIYEHATHLAINTSRIFMPPEMHAAARPWISTTVLIAQSQAKIVADGCKRGDCGKYFRDIQQHAESAATTAGGVLQYNGIRTLASTGFAQLEHVRMAFGH